MLMCSSHIKQIFLRQIKKEFDFLIFHPCETVLISTRYCKQVMHIERYDKHIYRKRETTNVQTKNKKVVGTHDANKKKSNTHKCYYFSIDR